MFNRNPCFSASLAGAASLALLLAANSAGAASLTFDLDDVQGSDSSITQVTLEDITGGVMMSFLVTDPDNTADISAVYFDLAFTAPAPPFTITGDPGVVTGVGYDTNNVQTGNIGAEFDVGVAIGNPGSGSDFFNAFSFTVEAAGLDVTDFFGQSFAARGQSVGAGPDGGEGSSKMFGTASRVLPPPDAQPPAVPLPAGAVLLISGLVTMGGLRARRKAAPLG